MERVNGFGHRVKESFNTPHKTDSESENIRNEKLKRMFIDFLVDLLRGALGVSNFRPIPPLIGQGLEVDLFKLYIVVRKRGFLWSDVAKDCGFDSKFGPALKLVYVFYLDILDKWLSMIANDKKREYTGDKEMGFTFTAFPLELNSDLKLFFFGICDQTLVSGDKGNDSVELNLDDDDDDDDDDDKSRDEIRGGDVSVSEEPIVVESVELNLDVDDKSCDENRGGDVNVSEEPLVVESGDCDNQGKDDASVCVKRKREGYFPMLNWIRKVAKDPCDPVIGTLPEWNKWNRYGSELQWKQLLLFREAMLSKKNTDASSEQSVWQKKQKMHPSMYDDQLGSERLRSSRKFVIAKDSSGKRRVQFTSESSSSGCQSDEDLPNKQCDSPVYSFINCRRKKIPISPRHQADLPEFCESRASYKSDSNWLGSRVWPLDKGEQKKNLIERDPIGKGRQELCGCQFPGSRKCVKLHITEKRMKLKLELGSAYYMWKFNCIGEAVALYWTKEDEHKFQDIVKSNHLSLDKYFWEELLKKFPNKGREALVNYYYNVFILRRRAHQNRYSPSCIDSGDEESDNEQIGNRFGQVADISPGSIFRSPKKPRFNRR